LPCEIKSLDGRKGINWLGAYNPKEGEHGHTGLWDQRAVIGFLKELRRRNKEDTEMTGDV
jgi:hypothetical protein